MKKPYHVIAFAVQTRDGFIARDPNHSTLDWRSDADAKFFTGRLDGMGERDVIVVGNTTYKTVEDRLSRRKCIVLTRSVRSTDRRNPNVMYFNPEGTSFAAVLTDYHTVVLLGGTETYKFFLGNDLIDELFLTVEPVEFGEGLRLFDPPEALKERFRLESIQSLSTQGTELRHYFKKVARARE